MSIIPSEQLSFKHLGCVLCSTPPPSSLGGPCPLKEPSSLPTLLLPHRRCQGAAEKTKPWAFSSSCVLPKQHGEGSNWGMEVWSWQQSQHRLSNVWKISVILKDLQENPDGSFPTGCFVETKVLEVQSATSEVEFLPKLWTGSRIAKGQIRPMVWETEIISSWYDGVSYRVYQSQPKGAGPKYLWSQWMWLVWNCHTV